MKYKEQLSHQKWKEKRLEILIRDNYECKECRCKNNKLEVHHGYYENGLMAWEYDNKYLHTLCRRCHESTHYYINELLKLSGEMIPSTIRNIYGILYYLNQKANSGFDFDSGDLFAYSDLILESIRRSKGFGLNENEDDSDELGF